MRQFFVIQYQMISKIIIVLIWITLFAPLAKGEEWINSSVKINSKLRRIEGQIERRVRRDQSLKLRFSRLFENIFPNEGNHTALEDVEIVPSISLPYKDNFYYSMMLHKNGDYFSLRGDLIISGQNKKVLVSSVRNQYTYFGQFHNNGTVVIYKLKVMSRQLDLEKQISIETQEYKLEVSHLFVVTPAGQLNYVLVDDKAGRIIFFDRNGVFIREVNSNQAIVQIDKFGNNLIVLTEQEMFYLGVGRYQNKTDCVLPEGSIDSFLLQDSNYRFIYAVRDGYLYQYDLGQHCRPIRSYHLPKNVKLYLTTQMVFAQSDRGTRFALNLTDGSLKPYQLPVQDCQGPNKQSVIRKLASQYIISRLCLTDEKIVITHILVDFEVPVAQIADFSKFRIPLLLFSFGVIIYVTVKNKKRQKALEEQQQFFKQALMGKLQALKENGDLEEGFEAIDKVIGLASAMKLKAP